MTGLVMIPRGGGCGGKGGSKGSKCSDSEDQNQVSFVEVLLAALRKSMIACRVDRNEDVISTVHHMEIGWPTNVQHITHVTFDRFQGFLGLPVEFEVEIPGRVPSASVSVFGVSAESMQCSCDSKGNSVPTILLLMQERLYTQRGLKAEGIFRINPENSQEEHVRDQLNKGIIPDNIDVHCLAGLIKAWFRELPSGVLDGLLPEQVLQCNTEEEVIKLVKQLNPTEAALLNWAVDLMADVVEEEEFNKMNARNIAMVFAPNMTQMSDPLTALMHAVQVMNLLKTLITKTLREREEEIAAAGYSPMSSHYSDLPTDEDLYSPQEIDRHSSDEPADEDLYRPQEMDKNDELRGPNSDFEDNNTHYTYTSEEEEDEDENEEESLIEIQEHFLKQMDENKNITSISFAIQADPSSTHPDLKVDFDTSFTDSKNGTSGSSTSGGEDLETSINMFIVQKDEMEIMSREYIQDGPINVVMEDKAVELISRPIPPPPLVTSCELD